MPAPPPPRPPVYIPTYGTYEFTQSIYRATLSVSDQFILLIDLKALRVSEISFTIDDDLPIVSSYTLEDTFRPEDVERLFNVLKTSGEEELVDFGIHSLRLHDSCELIVRSTCLPIADAAGQTSLLLVARDITEWVALRSCVDLLESDLARLRDQALSFLKTLSHEVRTPLTGIMGFSSLLADELDADKREMLSHIETSGERLLQTMDSLMEITLLGMGAVAINRRPLEVISHVRSSLYRYRRMASAKGVSFEMGTHHDELIAELDEEAFTKILHHVVGNAIKFTPSGHITVEIITAEDTFLLRVTDSGIGIDSEFLPQLFEPFSQESKGAGRHFEGIGAGLAIVKGLVDLHEGRIEVRSEKGSGTVVDIIFPVRKGHLVENGPEIRPVSNLFSLPQGGQLRARTKNCAELQNLPLHSLLQVARQRSLLDGWTRTKAEVNLRVGSVTLRLEADAARKMISHLLRNAGSLASDGRTCSAARA